MIYSMPKKAVLFVITTIFLMVYASLVNAVELPLHQAVPGGIAIIKLDETGGTAPKVTYKNNPVMVIQHQGAWHAVVGIPLSGKAGEHSINSISAAHNKKYSFIVADKAYKTQHITIKDKRKVSPNEEDMKRIRREKKKINAALAHWDDTFYADSPLLDLPTEGPLSSPFGLRRYFNEQPRNPHSGIDIAAPKGTPITAPATGKVILTGDFFFNGNSVFLDHGQGLVTMYCHMDSIEVKEGEIINKGKQIGTVGMTGRVTGPHLHWSVSMNDARIDPNLIVPALQQSISSEEASPNM